MYCKSDPDPPVSSHNNCLALFARCLVLTPVPNAVITHAKVLSVETSKNSSVSADSLNFLKASCKTALKKYCQALGFASFGDMIPILSIAVLVYERPQVSRHYSLFADQMDTGTCSGFGSGTGYFIAHGVAVILAPSMCQVVRHKKFEFGCLKN